MAHITARTADVASPAALRRRLPWPGLLALLWLVATAQGAPAQDDRPLSEQEHAAWHAIGRINVGGLNRRGVCTGALIAPDLVLTAGHCVPDRAVRRQSPEKVHFLAGWFRDGSAAHRTAAEIHVHPDYVKGKRNGTTLYSDIALLVLDEPIAAEEVVPLPLAPMPGFADGVEILAYSNRRPEALARAGPCVALALTDDLLGTTCPVRSGNSGAPVLERTGEGWAVIAVTVATNTGEGAFRSFAARPAEVLFELAGREVP